MRRAYPESGVKQMEFGDSIAAVPRYKATPAVVSRREITLTPTSEQESIVGCRLGKGELILIDAFAGAGKTTTFELMARQNPGRRFLYVCYNRELADAAKARFGPNVECKTSHSLAYAAQGYRFREKLGNLRAVDVRAELEIGDITTAFCVLETLNNFMYSAKTRISEGLVPEGMCAPGVITPLAQKLWEKVTDPCDPTIMPHDAYLKQWIMSKPDLSKYDAIFLDEGQDANPLLLSLVMAQRESKSCAVVIVGDRHQGIYAWRHAANAMEHCAKLASQRYVLTESFRFSQVIADYANRILHQFKGEKHCLIGRASGERPAGPPAYLSRTNAGLIGRAIEEVRAGHSINFAATNAMTGWNPYSAYKFAEMLDVWHHMKGERELVKTPYLQRFRSFAEISEAIEGETIDVELKTMVDLAGRYRGALPCIINDITHACVAPDKADICFSTGHRAKGKEWAVTQIGDDFLPVYDPRKLAEMRTKLGRNGFEQEVNLLYVVLTRTRSDVTMPSGTLAWFHLEHAAKAA